MAKFLLQLEHKRCFEEEYYERIRVAEYYRDVEYRSCVRIQAWYRGMKIREYLRYLDQCATKIQKRWRGGRGREFARAVKKLRDESRWLFYRYTMATKIQCAWRGYHSRRYILDFRERKKYFQGLAQMNDIVRKELNAKARELERKQRAMEEERNREELRAWAGRNHYLLSTEVIHGVYNSPYREMPDCLEHWMKMVKVNVKPKSLRGCVSSNSIREESSPIGGGLKNQGPFRTPSSVRRIRDRPPRTTLRVETDYESVLKARQKYRLEEWTKRISDSNFIVPGRLPPLPYKPSICYVGTQEKPKIELESSAKNFRTVFPPISAFDDYAEIATRLCR